VVPVTVGGIEVEEGCEGPGEEIDTDRLALAGAVFRAGPVEQAAAESSTAASGTHPRRGTSPSSLTWLGILLRQG